MELLDATRAVIDRTVTDETGAFSILGPQDAAFLRVTASIDYAGSSLLVTTDALGQAPHAMEAELLGRTEGLDLLALEDHPSGPAGAFHILDTLYRGILAVEAWTGEVLPPLYVFWGRGITTSWSYYRGERPAGSNRFCLELLGGEPGAQATSDTDEHDESIILHEFGHFVMDRLSTDSSPGGMHPAGHLIDPGLAWEEGRASFFASAVLGHPWYLDTIGLAPQGSLRVAHNLERGANGPKGLGSEASVGEVLWDLADGTEDLPDDDGDPVALGPAAVLRAMMALKQEEGAYPALSTLLQKLLQDRTVDEASLRQLLVQGGHPTTLIQPDTQWPAPLELGVAVGSKIDGLTQPAPSGGPNRPENGYDAVHAYRVHVDRPGLLGVRLRIFGSGRVADRQDLDVELRDTRANHLASDRGEDPIETVSRLVQPGHYVVYVRDGGNGNRVGYSLLVTLE
ncbi:MAG: hypothetical protein AAGF12_27650 [Myxococcota bacterium]